MEEQHLQYLQSFEYENAQEYQEGPESYLTKSSLPPASLASRRVVGMVLDDYYPGNLRVKREALALAEAGYEVHLLCRAEAGRPGAEYDGVVYIKRIVPDAVSWTLPVLGWQWQWPYKGVVSDFFRVKWAIDFRWGRWLKDWMDEVDVDVLHVHDLPLLPTCRWVADRYRTKKVSVIADLNENYPALKGYQSGLKNPTIQRRVEDKWLHIERDALLDSTHIIVPTHASMARLEKSWVEPERVTVVENAVDLEAYQHIVPDVNIAHQYKTRFVVAYAGQLDEPFRGVELLIRSIPHLLADIPNLSVLLLGNAQSEYAEQLLKQAYDLGVGDVLEMIVGLTDEDVVHYLDVADVCVWPSLKESYTEAIFPQKVTLAHALGKAIVTSDCQPLADYISASEGGRVFASGDVKELAETICYLERDLDMRQRLGKSGRQYVKQTANWARAKKSLLTRYADILPF